MGRVNNKYGKLLVRAGIFVSPFVLFLLLYIILDPFKVIKSYDNYYDNYYDSKHIYEVILNRDYVNTMTFDKYYQKNQYNSFILGNSRSMFYEMEDWKSHIGKESRCYHFDAFGESLYGICKKVNYIEEKKLKMDNVLLILDYSTLVLINPLDKYLNIISPPLEKYKNFVAFHVAFIKAFCMPKFTKAYLDYRISGEIKPYMIEEQLFSKTEINYDLKTNEITYPEIEKLINEGKYYTEEKIKTFHRNDTIQTYSPVVIKNQQKEMLRAIFESFERNKTHYKIIISPLYNQEKLNSQDLEYLESLFGKQHVFDFSGINEFTKDYSNYYDSDSHYRPLVSREILQLIYKNN
jgi:hypothetical protein